MGGFIDLNLDKISENFFKMHCENFSKGGEFVLNRRDGISKRITSYDDIAESFPQLSDDFKTNFIEQLKASKH